MEIRTKINKNILCWFYIYNTDVNNNRNITGIVIIKNLFTDDQNYSKTVTYFIYCHIEDDDQKNEFINKVIDNNTYSEIIEEIDKEKIVIKEYSNDSLKEFLIDHAK
jgi:hypothetical protein